MQLNCPCCNKPGCCHRRLPVVLHVVVGIVPVCVTFDLTYDPTASTPPALTWKKLGQVIGGCDYDFILTCNADQPDPPSDFWVLTINDHNTGFNVDVIDTFSTFHTPTCNPLYLPFSSTSIPGDFPVLCGCPGLVGEIDVME